MGLLFMVILNLSWGPPACCIKQSIHVTKNFCPSRIGGHTLIMLAHKGTLLVSKSGKKAKLVNRPYLVNTKLDTKAR